MFRFLDHTADLAVEITSRNMEALFAEAVSVWRQIVLGDSDFLPVREQTIRLEADTPEELLVELLSRINYDLLVNQWVGAELKNIRLINSLNSWKLEAILEGESFNRRRHFLETEIKAVTFYKMKIKQMPGECSTVIVFDT